MAERESGSESIRLYADEPADTGDRSGIGDTGEATGDNGPRRISIGTDEPADIRYNKDGSIRKRRTRRANASAGAPSVSKSEISALAYPIAMSLQVVFRVPAQVRTRQWPLIEGRPAGAFWLLSDAEAIELAEAWARVAVIYLPADQLSKGGAIGAAVMSTIAIIGDRVYQDAQLAQVFKADARKVASVPAYEEPNGYSGGNE